MTSRVPDQNEALFCQQEQEASSVLTASTPPLSHLPQLETLGKCDTYYLGALNIFLTEALAERKLFIHNSVKKVDEEFLSNVVQRHI